MRKLPTVFATIAVVAVLFAVSEGVANGVADAPGCTQLVSGSRPPFGLGGASYGKALSPDARYVLFDSEAANFGVVDANGQERDVYVLDMQTQVIELVSKSTSGAQFPAGSQSVAITPDGRFVVFVSTGDFVGPGNGLALYLRDRQLGTTTLIVGQYLALWPTLGALADISDDGRFVVFVTPAALVAQDTNGVPDVYRLDRASGQTILVSVADDESTLPQGGVDASVSADGNRVMFHSDSMNPSGVRHIGAGTTRRIIVQYSRITSDGSLVVGLWGNYLQTFDANSGALLSSLETGFFGGLAGLLLFDVSANGRYATVAIGGGPAITVVDRILGQWWVMPSVGSYGYVANDGIVSSTAANPLGYQAYLFRGPISTAENAPLVHVPAGTTKDIRVTGRNIFEGASFSFGPGTTTTVIGYEGRDIVNLRVAVDPFALDIPRELTIVSPISGCQTTKAGLLEVIPAPPPPTTTVPPGGTTTTTLRGQVHPQVFDFSPAVLRPGVPQNMIILGNNFFSGARVEIADTTVTEMNYVSNRRLEVTVVVDPSARGARTVRVVNPDGRYGDSSQSIEIRGSEGEFHAMTPYRAYDSRTSGELVAGERTVRITGLPSSGVRAVVANLTITGATADSYLTVYRAGTSRPPTSNINFGAGETKANLVTFEVNEYSDVSLFNADGSVHVILDVVGYYTEAGALSSGAFVGIDPYRRFDSRIDRPHPLGPNETVSLPILTNGEPASAVLLNVTATNPTATSYLTVWPTGEPRPTTSSVNFEPGQTVPNLIAVPVGLGGTVSFYNFAGDADVIIDVLGWFENGTQPIAGGRFVSAAPHRVLDTRLGVGASAAALGPHRSIALDSAQSNIPGSATAIVMNVTVAEPTEAGYLTVWPGATVMPGTSNVNFTAGKTTANLIVVRIGPDRRTNFFNAYGSTHVIADVVGYYN